jgi:apolipoprotein N-acyltransferase
VSRRGRLVAIAGAAVASGLLCWGYGRAEAPWHWLGWLALAPWLWAQDEAQTWRGTVAVGWAFSALFCAAVLWWLPVGIQRYTGLPLGAGWALLLALSPLLQPQFLACACARRAAPSLAWAVGPLAYVGVEWAFPKLVGDTFGYGLHPSPLLRQAAWLGTGALTLALVGSSEGLARAARALPRRKMGAVMAGAGLSLGLLACCVAAGAVRALRPAGGGGRTVLIGAVQTNLTRYGELARELGTYEGARLIIEAHTQISTRLVRGEGVQLVVWPETAYPTTYGAPRTAEGSELDTAIEGAVAALGVPLLFGTYDVEDDREFNAAVLLAPDGRRLGTYRKVHLFPLTEEVPGVLDQPWIRGVLPWLGTWSPGAGAQVLEITLKDGAPLRVAPSICYDSLDPGLSAEAARAGAEVLISISNDAWFEGTPALRLHLIAAAFRSVETGLPQVRVTPSGISASIDARGEVLLETTPGRPAGLVAEVALPAPDRRLPSSTWAGAWTGPGALALAVALVLWRRLARRGAVMEGGRAPP